MKEAPPLPLLTIQVLDALHAVEDRLEAALEPLGLSLAKVNVLTKLVAAGEPLPLGALAVWRFRKSDLGKKERAALAG